MFKFYLIFFFLIFVLGANADNREKIINNLKNTSSLSFEFEQKIMKIITK